MKRHKQAHTRESKTALLMCQVDQLIIIWSAKRKTTIYTSSIHTQPYRSGVASAQMHALCMLCAVERYLYEESSRLYRELLIKHLLDSHSRESWAQVSTKVGSTHVFQDLNYRCTRVQFHIQAYGRAFEQCGWTGSPVHQ